MTQFGGPRSLEPFEGDRYATWDAAYVLGSLSSAERREYEAHLETCDRCRAAVADISGMPALLAMLDVDDVRVAGRHAARTAAAAARGAGIRCWTRCAGAVAGRGG